MVSKSVAAATILALWFASSTVMADEAADHEALKSLVKEYETAIQRADPSVLEPFLAPGFTGVMVTGEEVNNFKELSAYWDKIQKLLGEGGEYTVKIDIPEPATIVGDVAYAHGTTADVATTSDGKEYKFEGFWTAICRREADGWKIVRIHGSMDAITNTFVAAALQSAAMPAAVVGGLVGLVVGAVASWLIAKRRPTASN